VLKVARQIVIGTLMTLPASAAAFAQGRPPVKSAQDSYKAGVSAVKSQNWDLAITNLKAAVQVDSNSRSYRDGTIGDEYWPQFYLFVAYVGKKDFVNASSLNAQKGNPPGSVQRDGTAAAAEFLKWQENNRLAQQNKQQFDRLLGDGNNALNAKRYEDAIAAFDNASKVAGIDDATKKQATDRLAQARVARDNESKVASDNQKRLNDFNAAFGRGNTAFAGRQWADAIGAYNSARSTFPEEFLRQNGQSRLDEANRNVTADRQARTDFDAMVARGNTAYATQNWTAAIKEFTDARNKLPDAFNQQNLQSRLSDATRQKSDRDFFDNAVKTAEAAVAKKDYVDAAANYRAAKDRIPTEFASQRLQAKLDAADAEAKKPSVEQQRKAEILSQARIEEATRAKTALGDATAAEKNAHDGLLALLTGDAAKASPLLEQAVSASANASVQRRALLSGYLAVAYATQSIQKNDKALESKARDQFRQALQIQKGYKLEDKLVSPQVRKLLSGTD
jgi:hypothetical protein